ncbi:MAG: carboxypeptidase-like regulatory domain-containing protein, partial [Bacteroidales bacterium]|nr:carboxypeptidase-like regulatory domain-containing protein [Bacteroidales bacterium]
MKDRILILVLINCLATLTVFSQSSTDQLKLSLVQQQLKDPAGIEFKSPQSYAEVIECFPGAMVSHPCTNFTTFAPSTADPALDYLVATSFENLTMPIGGLIRVWGLRAWFSGGWSECFEDPMEFEIGFWEDNNGEPGNLVYSFDVLISPTDIGEIFGSYPLWQWDFYMPGQVNLVDGWFTVQSTANNVDCWFLWVNAPDYPGTGLQYYSGIWQIQDFPFGFCFGAGWPQFTNDVSVTEIISPTTSPGLEIETVEIRITNFGTAAQSNFDVSYQVNSGPIVTEIFTGNIPGWGVADYTFTQVVDLSGMGQYDFEACTYLPGDENPTNDCTTKTVINELICAPVYSTGCYWGDGLTFFDIDNQINNTTGCDNISGNGWSQYLGLSPVTLFPGLTYNVTAATGYSDQDLTVWIDFNDDHILETNEIVVDCFNLPTAGTNYTTQMTVSSGAYPGQHLLRAMANWQSTDPCPYDPCSTFAYGETEDYWVQVLGNYASLEGYVYESGTTNPVVEATVEWLNESGMTNCSGYYALPNIAPGTATAYANHPDYCIDSVPGVTVILGQVTSQNFGLTWPEINTNPDPSVGFNEILDLNQTLQTSLKIYNPGSCELEYNIEVTEITKNTDVLDWFWLDWYNGIVSSGDSTIIPVTMNSSNYPNGTIKTALIEIINNSSNDPISMDVTMKVESTIELDLKVFLEGAFNTNTGFMNTYLYNGGLVPLVQPYAPPLPYYGNPMPEWYYIGVESVTNINPDVVDWILVEIRDALDASSATPSTTLFEFPAFLKSDGTVIALDFISNPVVPVEII